MSSSSSKPVSTIPLKRPARKSTSTMQNPTSSGSGQQQRVIHPSSPSGYNTGFDPATQTHFNHTPTNLPPVAYPGRSPYDPPPRPQRIHTTAQGRLTVLEQRIGRAEQKLEHYVEIRSQGALNKSKLPRSGSEESSSGDRNATGSRN